MQRRWYNNPNNKKPNYKIREKELTKERSDVGFEQCIFAKEIKIVKNAQNLVVEYKYNVEEKVQSPNS